MAKVFVGMSGGVDSSVSALLLKEQGYDVTGVYMKNWSEDLPGMKCPWAEDLADAKRIAVRLDLPFKVWDFEEDYREKVVNYMLTEFRAGRTPNPDIICNQEIKFKLFYDRAREAGADFIATGHYAKNLDCKLARARDENKDQTYFLYRISSDALRHTLFPLGEMLKPEVKKLAEENGLHNAYKKESMGVCFVGEVGMRDFLKTYIDINPGEIREAETEKVLGSHEGAVFYTIGQRHGLYLSGVAGESSSGLPYYVVDKDLENNIVYVSRDLNYPSLWTDTLELNNVFLRRDGNNTSDLDNVFLRSDVNNVPSHASISMPEVTSGSEIIVTPETILPTKPLFARLRHRGELIPATFDGQKVHFKKPIKRPAAGQSAVLYDDKICLGGGFIS